MATDLNAIRRAAMLAAEDAAIASLPPELRYEAPAAPAPSQSSAAAMRQALEALENSSPSVFLDISKAYLRDAAIASLRAALSAELEKNK